MKTKSKFILGISLSISFLITKNIFPNATDSAQVESDTNIITLAARISQNEYKIDNDIKREVLKSLNEKLQTNVPFDQSNEYFFEHTIHEIYKKSNLSEKNFAEILLNSPMLSSHTRTIESIIRPAPKKVLKRNGKELYIAVGPLFGEECGNISLGKETDITLDLTGNYGGSTTCANNIIELLSNKNHSYVIQSNSLDRVINLTHKATHKWNKKTILVDEQTASSAELIAWILKEDGWEIEGKKTFGKNSVQVAYFDTDYPYTINYGRYITELCQTDGCKITPSNN